MKQILLIVSIIIGMQSLSFSQSSIKSFLKGSKKSQKTQHQHAKAEDLSYIKNDIQLKSMKQAGYLVPITSKVKVDPDLVKKFRYVRRRVNTFLIRFQSAFQNKFGKNLKIEVKSAVRTEEYQEILCKKNGNAAKKSSHPTGATIDLGKLDLTAKQLKWMQEMLVSLEKRGLIEATEEHCQAVFHVMVFKKYETYVKSITKKPTKRKT